MRELLQQIFDNPLPSLAIVGNLIIIESLLSVDNAAVLATMVMDLPNNIRPKALRYGIWGAYIFRGLALIFASFLTKIWWLKPIGGLYLLYLVWDWRKGKMAETKEDDFINKKGNFFYRVAVKPLGNFWATVLVVEIMDMAFSIDNVFAAVAFSSNIILIITGVFIGIFAMRFIAQWFVKLMEKYAFLETSAFIVIGILGIKLLLSLDEHYMPQSLLGKFSQSRSSDITMSLLTIVIFFVPILVAIIRKPKK